MNNSLGQAGATDRPEARQVTRQNSRINGASEHKYASGGVKERFAAGALHGSALLCCSLWCGRLDSATPDPVASIANCHSADGFQRW